MLQGAKVVEDSSHAIPRDMTADQKREAIRKIAEEAAEKRRGANVTTGAEVLGIKNQTSSQSKPRKQTREERRKARARRRAQREG